MFAAIGVIGIVVTAAYILWKIIQYVFLGEFNQEKWDEVTHGAKLTDMLTFEKVTMWPLVLFMIGFGVFPTPHHQLLQQLCPEALWLGGS